MQASDYIRASEPAQAMTKYCRENGFSFAVERPGSKGHPFLIVTAKGKTVKVPFSMTPSDSRNAGRNAVTSLKRALYEVGIGRKPAPQSKAKPRPAPVEIYTTSEGAPILPAGIELDRHGGVTGIHWQKGGRDYLTARRKYITEQILAGKTTESIAKALSSAGVRTKKTQVVSIFYEQRAAGNIPADWTPAIRPITKESATPKAKAETPAPVAPIPAFDAPVEQTNLPNPLNGAFSDLVLGALKDARAKSASEADGLATVWIEKIAAARKQTELDAIGGEIDARYMRVLEALTD